MYVFQAAFYPKRDSLKKGLFTMDFKSAFLHSLISAPKLSMKENPELFLGEIFPWENEGSSPLLKLLSKGKQSAYFPWSFDIRSMDCFLLLHTENGCGKLLIGSQIYSLDEGSFLLLDCGQHFRIDIAKEPWNYNAAFLAGDTLPYYRRLFPKDRFSILQTCPFSDLTLSMERLLAQFPGECLSRKLMTADLLGHMVITCLSFSLKETENAPKIPPYIEKIHALFDQEFQGFYSLDQLERQFEVSKYRICREFSAAYGISPLQYLNRRRIDIAAHLLLTTGHRIHTVGNMVGIDNTSHFISLFKKYTGQTPLEYKQRMAN